MSLDCSEVTNWIAVQRGLTEAIAWGQWGDSRVCVCEERVSDLAMHQGLGSGHQGIMS